MNDAMYKKYIEEYKDFPIEDVTYYDLNPLYHNAIIRSKLVGEIYDQIKGGIDAGIYEDFDYIGVIESRGYIIGSMLAHDLNKGLVLLRSKPNRLPGRTSKVKHSLEYGIARMEVQNGSGKVLIFDDVYATGGTFAGAMEVLKTAGYVTIGGYHIVELDYIESDEPVVPMGSLLQYG
jgi:adenine phosphoribosyltransferase